MRCLDYELINPINPEYSVLEQVLTNRGIAYENIEHYLNVSEEDNLPCTLLNNIENAVKILIKNLHKPNFHVHIQVDKCSYCPL